MTPHNITLVTPKGTLIAEFPSKGIARVSAKAEVVGSVFINGTEVSLTRNTYGEVTGLPETKKGTIYIVSRLVLSALKGSRPDVVVPGSQVRNADGVVVGCASFDVE